MYTSESANLRYAVVEAKWLARPAERFVVEYYSEESLLDLIARPSIVGSGFISRKEALALIPDSFTAPNLAWRTETGGEAKEKGAAKFGDRLLLQDIWVIPRRLLYRAAALFVLISCSKNVFSMALRAFMSI
jgi:hypothetical protein